MTNRDHRAEAERLLNDADEWGQQAGEPTPEVGELACLAYSIAHALLAIHDTLTAADPAPTNPLTETHPWPPWPTTGLTHTRGTQWDADDRYALNEERQREEAELDTPSGRAFTAWDKEVTDAVRARINALSEWLPAMEKALTPEPDPLDEDNHGERLDSEGDPWGRNPGGCWHIARRSCPGCGRTLAYVDERYGPLTFAPEPPQEAAGDDLSASGDEGGSVEGPDADIAHKAAMDAALRKMLAIVEGWEGKS